MAFSLNFPLFTILLPMSGAVACLLLNPKAVRVLSIAGPGAVVLMSAVLLSYTMGTGESYPYLMGHFPAPFGNELRVGPLESLMALLFSVIFLLSLCGGLRDLDRDVPEGRRTCFFIMANMLLSSMLAILYTNDLFTAYVFIEIITICACTLVMVKPGGRTLLAAAVYFVMSLLGSGLVLFSIAILYGVTGHLLMPNLFTSVQILMATGQYSTPLFTLLGLLAAGLGIKSALFPFHAWLPDAHAGATTAASSILSGLIIKCYLLLLIKVFFRIFGLQAVASLGIADVLLAFGVCGLLYGSVSAMRQRNVKRMLSYASVSQIGFICICIGLNTRSGMAAACYHILAHGAAKAMLFCAAGGLSAVSGHQKDLAALRGSGRRDPLCGAAFAVGSLSMVGIPLFSGFLSKLYLAEAALEGRYAAVVLACIAVGTVLSAMYYLPATVCILAKSPGCDRVAGGAVRRPLSHRIALLGFLAVNLFLGLRSPPVIRAIEAGLNVFGP